MILTDEKCVMRKKLNIIDVLFVVFCLMPFILPNPILKTDVQPYAMILGVLVILIDIVCLSFVDRKAGSALFGIAGLTFLAAIVVMVFSGFSMNALRALYNYLAVAVIPYAAFIVIKKTGELPESLIKVLILIWFFVGSVQFFVSRSFMSGLISGSRFSESYRGVLGLASEPSFFGIACFYFLHMTQRFKKHQIVFMALAVLMGVLYAQSAMGIIFIAAFLAVYLVDALNTKVGKYIWTVAVVGVIAFFILLNTVLVGTRIHELYSKLVDGGADGLLSDESASVRFNAVIRAITNAFENFLMPMGFGERIGSGYGGFLCELGLFSLPILAAISGVMAKTFNKKFSRVAYFILVTALLFNNTQIGNPLLLFVLGMNVALPNKEIVRLRSEKKNDVDCLEKMTEDGGAEA